jgi:DNA-binding beta-propeller fold protein YncE
MHKNLFLLVVLAFVSITFIHSQIITTLAGGPYTPLSFAGDGGQASLAEFNYPTGISVDSVNNLIYVTDNKNNKIRVINLASGIINAFAGGSLTAGFSGDGSFSTSAVLNGPTGVAIDAKNNLGKFVPVTT